MTELTVYSSRAVWFMYTRGVGSGRCPPVLQIRGVYRAADRRGARIECIGRAPCVLKTHLLFETFAETCSPFAQKCVSGAKDCVLDTLLCARAANGNSFGAQRFAISAIHRASNEERTHGRRRPYSVSRIPEVVRARGSL